MTAERQDRFVAPSFLLLALALLVPGGCGNDAAELPPGAVRLTAWFHSGMESERLTIQNQVERFNAIQDAVYVDLQIIPQGAYNAQVQAASLSGDLPDLLEFDGPFLYNYDWQGQLLPLDDLLPKAVRDDLLDSIIDQGTFAGRLYSVGVFDSGLGLYVRRSALTAIGARIPEGPDDAWTTEEFDHILRELAKNDPDSQVLDLKLSYKGEWFTYAFSPTLQSAGGGLIDRSDYRQSIGILDGPSSVSALARIQNWIRRGFVDPNLDDAAFTSGRVAISWVGHWEYPRYSETFGDDLLVLPLPDFGSGTRTGQGSWNCGVTTNCANPEAAMRFLTFLLQPEEVLAMADANGAVPATRSAIARSQLYGTGGPLRLFARQLLEGYTVPRPRTPAYPVITSVFQEAFQDIRNGVDVKGVLKRAARTIDEDIEDNRGYKMVTAGGV